MWKSKLYGVAMSVPHRENRTHWLVSTQVAITIDDDDVEAATSKAREAERRKRERLARDDDGEGWLVTAP